MLSLPCQDDRILLGISDDTRQISKDWLYVCRKVKGQTKKRLIQEALNKGAVVLCDHEQKREHVYVCQEVEHVIQVLIDLYYGLMCEQLQIIGVTGTNGKTSVSSYIYQLMNMSGKRFMRIGTKEVCYLNQKDLIPNTTPDCFQLAILFQKALTLGLDGIVMEVSSHAIDANRICFVTFDIVIYTNITQDHLDYHLTKTHYRFTKFKLRKYVKDTGCVIYNNDLPEMKEFPLLYQGKRITIGSQAHFSIRDIKLSACDAEFSIQGYSFHTNLLGMINIYNVASVIAAARILRLSYELLQTLTPKLIGVAGRMEVYTFHGIHVWIDYAHTPDALATLLQFASSVKTGRVISVVGCGGNRDQKKRALMADVAAEYSDTAIFTADNPRYERIDHILMDMLSQRHSNVEVYENRYFAIKHAILIAQNSDIIVVAGKGDESILSVQGRDYPFSDREVIRFFIQDEEENNWN